MNKVQIFFIMFLILILGGALGFLGTMKIRELKSQKAAAKANLIEQLSSSDLDFLNSYHDFKDNLSEDAKILGDRLYECLDQNSDVTEKKVSKKNPPEKTKRGFQILEPTPTAKNVSPAIPEGSFSPYIVAGKNVAPQQVLGSKVISMFADAPFKNPEEENFGVENGLIEDVKKFLKNHVCLDPDPEFSVITEERRARSKFFDVVKENTYKGNTKILSSNSNQTTKAMKTLVEFNSPTRDGADYIEIQDDKQNVMEKRVINPDTSVGAWRYTSCQPSVVLMTEDKCPWNNKFAYEFKDFYISPDSKKMVGNIYCKNPGESQWTNLGTFELNGE